MRTNRIIWGICLGLSLVAISFYGGVVSYGFFYAMLLIPVVALLYLVYVIVFFRIYQYSDGREYVVDRPVPYSFRLINEYHLPFAGIRVRFHSKNSTINELSDQTEYELLPGTGITKETTMVCHYRGEYEVGIREVEVQDYLRLFRIRYVNKESRRVIVNPKIVTLKSLKSFEFQARDSANNPSKLDIVTREYVPGDDVRFINWSQSARAGRIMTRERIGEEGNGVSVILDACRYSEDMEEYLPVENKLLELTIAISLFFCNRNIGSKEYHFNRTLTGQGVHNTLQFEELYKRLSSLHFDADNSQQQLCSALKGDEELFHSSVVYLVLPVWTQYAQDLVDSLSRRNVYTVVFLVSDVATFCETTERVGNPTFARPDLVDLVRLSPEAKLEEVEL